MFHPQQLQCHYCNFHFNFRSQFHLVIFFFVFRNLNVYYHRKKYYFIRKVLDLISFSENLVDFNEARFHEATLHLHPGLVISDYGVHEVRVTVCGIQHVLWVLGVRVRPGTRHFPNNGNPTRERNTTSLKCCLPSTDAIDSWENILACLWRFKVASRKRASLKSKRISKKEKRRIFLWQSST